MKASEIVKRMVNSESEGERKIGRSKNLSMDGVLQVGN